MMRNSESYHAVQMLANFHLQCGRWCRRQQAAGLVQGGYHIHQVIIGSVVQKLCNADGQRRHGMTKMRGGVTSRMSDNGTMGSTRASSWSLTPGFFKMKLRRTLRSSDLTDGWPGDDCTPHSCVDCSHESCAAPLNTSSRGAKKPKS